MTRVRIGIIGLGMAAAPHVQSLKDLSDRVEVAAAYSPTASRRAAFSQAYGLPASDDLDAMLADPAIAGVLVLTPPNTHLDLVTRAAQAGKHVLLEKPVETTLARAEQLVATAERGGVTLAMVLQHRFRPVSVALAEALRQGRLGQIVSASARLHNWRPQSYYDQPGRGTRARDGGGVLLTQAIHTLDLLISLAGLPTQVVGFATTSAVHRMETEDLAMGAIRFADGAIGSVSATTCAYPGFSDAIDIIGTRGMAQIEGTRLTLRFHDGASETVDDGHAGGGAGADPMAFSHHHHRAVIADFLDTIDTGRAPMVSGRAALGVHRLIDALLRSAASGRVESV